MFREFVAIQALSTDVALNVNLQIRFFSEFWLVYHLLKGGSLPINFIWHSIDRNFGVSQWIWVKFWPHAPATMLALRTWFTSSCASLTGFPGRKNSNFRHSATVCEPPRSQTNAFTIFFTFSCSFCSCAGLKPRTSPEAAMGDGVGPLNEALESVTTERVGVLSHTPTDPSQFLNFF